VRFLSGLLVLAVSIGVARAQEQEPKLLDRLLRPKMVLQNSAQNKNFAAKSPFRASAVGINSFHIPANAFSKPYSEQRTVSTREFSARHFRGGDASVATRQRTGLMIGEFPARASVSLRDAFENGRTSNVRSFADARPFSVSGKSQKFLSTENAPMTIDQVRELLNKNK
jgi:hypothetical protein